MIPKNDYKEKAIALRKQGLSYSEILQTIPVAKSTLSLWLHEFGLSTHQKQRLTEKKLAACKRGGIAKKQWRLRTEKEIKEKAAADINNISDYDLLIIGATLYWAEGSKQKTHAPSVGIIFSNSDLEMIKVFLKFLRKICKIPEKELHFEIYIHETADHKIAQRWWSSELHIDIDKFQKIYFKKNPIKKSYRKNTGDNYHGQLRIKVRNSANLNRKISGWTNEITNKVLKF
jgi:hypothetical protein